MLVQVDDPHLMVIYPAFHTVKRSLWEIQSFTPNYRSLVICIIPPSKVRMIRFWPVCLSGPLAASQQSAAPCLSGDWACLYSGFNIKA
jgi:hypothetical protein